VIEQAVTNTRQDGDGGLQHEPEVPWPRVADINLSSGRETV
jgi:hypothetical protein